MTNNLVVAHTPDEFLEHGSITWFYLGGKLYTGEGQITHAGLADKLGVEAPNPYAVPAGRISSQNILAVWFGEDEALSPPYSDSILALYNNDFINDDSIIYFYPSSKSTVRIILKKLYQGEGDDKSFSVYSGKNKKYENYLKELDKSMPETTKTQEESYDIDENIEFTFDYAKTVMENYFIKFGEIYTNLESEFGKVPNYYNLQPIVDLSSRMYDEFNEVNNIFKEAVEQGVLSLHTGMLVSAQRRMVNIPNSVYKIRNYTYQIYKLLKSMREEMMDAFNFAEGLDESKEKQILKWELAYASNLIFFYAKDWYKLYGDRNLWVQVESDAFETQVG